MWCHYETCFNGTGFVFSDPTGRVADAASPEVLLLWRKPFTDLMNFDDLPLQWADHEQARVQMRQWLQAVVALMKPQGRVRLIEPYADRRLPKLYQLYEARHFFAVPRSHFGVSARPTDLGPRIVVKPLGDPSVGQEDIFYTRRVDGDALFRPYPWFVQEALVEGHDITCVHIRGRNHFYECEFKRGETAIDWRVEINTAGQSSWHALKNSRLMVSEDVVNQYMKRLDLHYGRLDFILHRDTLFFLECNSNGQFGWLDEPDTLALHREFLNAALDPASAVN